MDSVAWKAWQPNQHLWSCSMTSLGINYLRKLTRKTSTKKPLGIASVHHPITMLVIIKQYCERSGRVQMRASKRIITTRQGRMQVTFTCKVPTCSLGIYSLRELGIRNSSCLQCGVRWKECARMASLVMEKWCFSLHSKMKGVMLTVECMFDTFKGYDGTDSNFVEFLPIQLIISVTWKTSLMTSRLKLRFHGWYTLIMYCQVSFYLCLYDWWDLLL